MLSRRAIFATLRTLNVSRTISFCSPLRAYDGEGKTTINVLNQDDSGTLMINGFSQVGFRLNNGITILGPMAIFPRSVLSWNIKELSDIDENSLQLFTVLEPKLDLVILGVGDKQEDLTFQKRIYPWMKARKLNVEILTTESACSTFNFLNSEGRFIAAALLPPKTIVSTEDDVYRSKLRYQNLYQNE